MSKKFKKNKKNKKSKFKATRLEGRFVSNSKGFGFVEVEGAEQDYFIPEKDVANAFHGDRVLMEVTSAAGKRRPEGRIVKVLEHEVSTVVGTYEKCKGFGYVVSDNQKITRDVFVLQGDDMGAVSGHKVVCELTNYGEKGRSPEGRIVEILGHENDPGVDILAIVKSFGLPVEFSEKVLERAARVAKPVSEADCLGRLDLRAVTMVTIDGEDAKDLDDAVSVCRKGDGYELGVHIADVTNYVQEKSALDKEALKRGTSTYLVDRVIPMLPHALSNGMCSLNAGEDRLAVSCIMDIDAAGKIIGHTLAETVIHVDRRMTYTSVKKILEDEDAAEMEEYAELVPMFKLMGELSAKLRANRTRRGAIDFDFPEAKVILNKKGIPVDIRPHERNVATELIEDFMLAANETVAEHFCRKQVPFVYRSHGYPEPEKLQRLGGCLGVFGYTIRGLGDKTSPKAIQGLLDKLDGRPEEDFLSRLVLRSMQQARYTVDDSFHFGLAAPYYCHFTSPIRRYPDLQIHRIIKDEYRGRLGDKRIAHYQELLPGVASKSSSLERRAEETEREVLKLKKVQYMTQHVGEVYEGVISGVTGWGLYVELPNTVEGLVHISSIPGDYFRYVEESYELIGERTNRHYRMGQPLRVKVIAADEASRTIDFAIAEDFASGNMSGSTYQALEVDYEERA